MKQCTLLAQAGTFRPFCTSILTYSTGVAVTSQVLCTSITLNKGYIFIYELFNCKRSYLPYSNAFAHACQHLIVIYFISAFNIGGGGIAFYGG